MAHPLYALATVRERRHLTPDSLAERAVITLPTLRRLEQGGRPTFKTARRLARALRVQSWALQHVGATSDHWRSADCPTCQAERARTAAWSQH